MIKQPEVNEVGEKTLNVIRNQISILEADLTRYKELIIAEKYEVAQLNKEKVVLTENIVSLRVDQRDVQNEIEWVKKELAEDRRELDQTKATNESVSKAQVTKELSLNERSKSVALKEIDSKKRNTESMEREERSSKEEAELNRKKEALQRVLDTI